MVVEIHADLVVTGEGIHKAEEFMAASTIRSIRGRGKLSLGHARLTSVKSMQSRHFPFAFFDKYDVGQPFRVLRFSDRTFLEELADLLINRFFCLSGAKFFFFA